MAWGGWEAMKMMVGNLLRLPPGTYVRDGEDGSKSATISMDNPVVEAIVDITADDVACTETPFYLAKFDENTPSATIDSVGDIIKELNLVAGSIARDLLSSGISVYKPQIISKRYKLIPIINPVKVYLMNDMSILVMDEKDHVALRDVICFLHYTKKELISDVTGVGDGYQVYAQIKPRPMQLATTGKTAQDLLTAENSILRYRALLSRIVRFISVDVGASQGDKISRVVNSIGAGINADSMSLTPSTDGSSILFDDNIPIIPHRGGIGKPDLVTDIPSADINKLADVDNLYNQLYLETRFPKSYADFSTALGSTAVSLIRGDIRYARMVSRARSLMERVVNDYLDTNKTLRRFHIMLKMVELPTPEDDDVMQSINTGTDITIKVHQFLIGESADAAQALAKLEQLEAILASSSQLPTVKMFMQMTKDYIERTFGNKAGAPEEGEGGEGGDDFGADDFGGGGDDFGAEPPGEVDFPEPPAEEEGGEE
jgi:hypothetical protein